MLVGERTRIGLWTPQVGIAGGRGGAHVHYAMHIAEADYDAAVAALRERGYDPHEEDFEGTAGPRTSPTRTATSSSSGHGDAVNRLAEETSPYLLQHADNPVDWYPWGDEAFAKARASDRPVLLSIGYSACHWCHVMAHESFEDDETAALMNELLREREGRPRGAARRRRALHGRGRRADRARRLADDRVPHARGRAVLRRHLLPAGAAARAAELPQVLTAVSDAYRDRRGDVARRRGARRGGSPLGRARALDRAAHRELLGEALRALRAQFDPEWGGWGGAPKFPQASTLEFLLRMHLRGDEDALPMVAQTLDAMAAGGMYDLLGGGFHRYSVDHAWLVPHFEKMLYDNALLAAAYLHAWVVTGDERYRRVVEETLDYLLRELRLPEGGFASAQDADTDGRRGADLHVDARRRACPRSCCTRSRTGVSSSAAS